MIIKERVFQECKCCGSRSMVSDEEYGCDNCGTSIAYYSDQTLLRATIHHHNDNGTESLHFCSWRCALAKLSAETTDYFISWPYISYDESHPERNAAAFWQAVREFGNVHGEDD